MSMVLTAPQRQAKQGIMDLASKMKGEIAAALPKHVTPERFLRVFQTAISSTPALLQCEQTSVLGSMVMASQLGIELNTPLGHGWLIPFKGKATLIIGYRGMIDLAMRSGRVQAIYAHEVFANDKFRYQLGSDPKINHVPAEGERGDFRGAYAVVVFKGGGSQFEYLTKAQIDKIRAGSPGKDKAPWVEHFGEMAKKSAIRRVLKYVPVSIEIQRAVVYEELVESNANFNALEMADMRQPAIDAPRNLDDLASGASDATFETKAPSPDDMESDYQGMLRKQGNLPD